MRYFIFWLTIPFLQAEESAVPATPQITVHYFPSLKSNVEQADEAALRGSQLYDMGDCPAAIEELQKALDLLPNAPLIRPRHRAYSMLYFRSVVSWAKTEIGGGNFASLSLIKDFWAKWLGALGGEPSLRVWNLLPNTFNKLLRFWGWKMSLILALGCVVVGFAKSKLDMFKRKSHKWWLYFSFPLIIPILVFSSSIIGAASGFFPCSDHYGFGAVILGAFLFSISLAVLTSLPYILGKTLGVKRSYGT